MSRLGHITKGWVTAQVGKLHTFTAVGAKFAIGILKGFPNTFVEGL